MALRVRSEVTPSMRVRAWGPGGDDLVGAGLGGEAVAEVGVGEGVDALVLLGVPAG
jgi:hypothetical protein